MTLSVTPYTDQAQGLHHSVEEFARQTPGVIQAIVVSEDGLLLAQSAYLGRDNCERFAAITSAMTSLAIGAARTYDLGHMNKLVVDLDRAFLLLGAFGAASWLGVMARRDTDLGDLARHVAAFVERNATMVVGLVDGLNGRLPS
jgi:predicted regulator of Ras-like GTPase activity (Roadblock/LC7/MglB family)